jgi:hypothetical protein
MEQPNRVPISDLEDVKRVTRDVIDRRSRQVLVENLLIPSLDVSVEQDLPILG